MVTLMALVLFFVLVVVVVGGGGCAYLVYLFIAFFSRPQPKGQDNDSDH